MLKVWPGMTRRGLVMTRLSPSWRYGCVTVKASVKPPTGLSAENHATQASTLGGALGWGAHRMMASVRRWT